MESARTLNIRPILLGAGVSLALMGAFADRLSKQLVIETVESPSIRALSWIADVRWEMEAPLVVAPSVRDTRSIAKTVPVETIATPVVPAPIAKRVHRRKPIERIHVVQAAPKAAVAVAPAVSPRQEDMDAKDVLEAFKVLRAQRRVALLALNPVNTQSIAVNAAVEETIQEPISVSMAAEVPPTLPVVAKAAEAPPVRRSVKHSPQPPRKPATIATVLAAKVEKPEPRKSAPVAEAYGPSEPATLNFSRVSSLIAALPTAPVEVKTVKAEEPKPEAVQAQEPSEIKMEAPVVAAAPEAAREPEVVEVAVAETLPPPDPDPAPEAAAEPSAPAVEVVFQPEGLLHGALGALNDDYSPEVKANEPEPTTQGLSVIAMAPYSSDPVVTQVPVVRRPAKAARQAKPEQQEEKKEKESEQASSEEQQAAAATVDPAESKQVASRTIMGAQGPTEVLTRVTLTEAVNDIVFTQPVAHVGAASGQWRVASAPDHWNTLYWKTSDEVPPTLLSRSSTWVLARLGEVTVQPRMGILVVRLAAGWRAVFSGRAEAPIALDDKQQRVADEDIGVSRTVVFLNVEPGRHLLTVSNPARGESGAVGVPVMEGAATAIPLDEARSETVTGWLLKADSRDPQGASGAYVQVLGRAGKGVFTDRTGKFVLKGVVSFNGMPVYLDAEGPEAYKHRYALGAQAGKAVTLFHFGRKTIDGWISQLPGGISPGSGIAVGAFPKLAASASDGLKVSVHPMVQDPSFLPEVYGMGGGSLQPLDRMTAEASNFVALQIPEGFAKVQAVDGTGTRYSDLLPVSRDVIHVIGPY